MFRVVVLVHLWIRIRTVTNSENVINVDICNESVKTIEPTETSFGGISHIRTGEIALKSLKFIVHFGAV